MNLGTAGATKAGTAARLLAAWRGEVEARAVYEALAARERDPQRAAILRRMADAERGHRARLEARMRDLGIAVPDPGSVRLSPWTRLQVRFAPIDRVLAWREAMENNESVDTYARPTGDAETDTLFAATMLQVGDQPPFGPKTAFVGEASEAPSFGFFPPDLRFDSIVIDGPDTVVRFTFQLVNAGAFQAVTRVAGVGGDIHQRLSDTTPQLATFFA